MGLNLKGAARNLASVLPFVFWPEWPSRWRNHMVGGAPASFAMASCCADHFRNSRCLPGETSSGFLLLRRSLRMHSDSSQNEQTHQDQYARNCAVHAFLLLPGLPAKVLRMVPDELRRLFVKRSHRTPAPEACQTSSPPVAIG